MAAKLPLYERYMRDEEREANRRMRRRDPLKAERQEAFRAGLSGEWRKSRPADMPDLADDDYEPVMYTQSQLDAMVAKALVKVSAFWFVACGIVVYVALTGVRP